MSNTQAAIDALNQLYKADAEIERLRAENESLKAKIEAFKKPMKISETLSIASEFCTPQHDNCVIASVEAMLAFAQAIQNTLLVRMDKV